MSKWQDYLRMEVESAIRQPVMNGQIVQLDERDSSDVMKNANGGDYDYWLEITVSSGGGMNVKNCWSCDIADRQGEYTVDLDPGIDITDIFIIATQMWQKKAGQ